MKPFGYTFISLMLLSSSICATILTPDLPKSGVISEENNKLIDPKIDYSKFMGRVSDKDKSGKILKVKVETNNTKFLKAGDLVYFKVNTINRKGYCKASVRSAEDFYFSMYVQDFDPCWDEKKYFPRGVQLNFVSKKMAKRVYEAAHYRELLILRKDSFIKQLNSINHYLWNYDQKRLKTAADFDERINEILREKQLALDNLINKKQEKIRVQAELIKKLDSIDESLDHYQVQRHEPIRDRWFMDQDRGLPVMRRPQKVKNR